MTGALVVEGAVVAAGWDVVIFVAALVDDGMSVGEEVSVPLDPPGDVVPFPGLAVVVFGSLVD